MIGVAIAGSLGGGVMGNAGVAFSWRPRDLIGMSSSFVFRKCFRFCTVLGSIFCDDFI